MAAPPVSYPPTLPAYARPMPCPARAMRCPVLSARMALPAVESRWPTRTESYSCLDTGSAPYAMSGTGLRLLHTPYALAGTNLPRFLLPYTRATRSPELTSDLRPSLAVAMTQHFVEEYEEEEEEEAKGGYVGVQSEEEEAEAAAEARMWKEVQEQTRSLRPIAYPLSY
eukprot:3267463-Rhodomonas_salina.1